MASTTQASGFEAKDPRFLTTPDKYISLGTLVDDYSKPDARELLIKRFGDQGITGFLKLTGAVNNVGTSDEVYYFEEGRRHKIIENPTSGVTSGGTTSTDFVVIDMGADADIPVQPNDLIMDVISGDVLIVIDTKRDGKINGAATALSNAGEFKAETLDSGNLSRAVSSGDKFAIVGNMYAQGSAEPSGFQEPDVLRHTQTFAIVKNKYEVNGSQATNIGYVNVGNGDYRWFIKGEMEARARFEDLREMTMLFGEQTHSDFQGAGNEGIVGTEGYFPAVLDRGIVTSGVTADVVDSFDEIDNIIKELDKQGAPAEYAMYLNRNQSLKIDDMLANGIGSATNAGLAGQFGAFNNSADMAINLGFKSFTRGGYTFHKHDWKLLNDANLLGAGTAYHGAMVPMTQVTDPQTGTKAPALEMNYKSANGYSRELEHWVTGGGVLGYRTDGTDKATFHYRSECALITRAANQHVVLKGLS